MREDKEFKQFIRNYMQFDICDERTNRETLLDFISSTDLIETKADALDLLGEPLHIYTARSGDYAMFYPSFAHCTNEQCKISELGVFYFLANDSLNHRDDASFSLYSYDHDSFITQFFQYWNHPNIPKQSKYGDSNAPIDFQTKNGFKIERREHLCPLVNGN